MDKNLADELSFSHEHGVLCGKRSPATEADFEMISVGIDVRKNRSAAKKREIPLDRFDDGMATCGLVLDGAHLFAEVPNMRERQPADGA